MPDFKKFCVFCGKYPDSKTNEHVVPQWLIKLTGNPNRLINLGFDTSFLKTNNVAKFRTYSFLSYKFPACKKCNEEFSKLESENKIVIEKIISKISLSNLEINNLLNWFDKVRTGIWLGNLQLDRDYGPETPKFYIKDRIAAKDRCLFVFEFNDKWKGIQFAGVNTPLFINSPSCFSLCINNFYFLNISNDFLFSKNIGFPYFDESFVISGVEDIACELKKGLGKFSIPLLPKLIIEPSLEIYQPIIHQKLAKFDFETLEIYKDRYIWENCLDINNGLGDIFYMNKNELIKIENNLHINFSDEKKVLNRNKNLKILAFQVYQTQLFVIKSSMPSTEKLTKQEKVYIERKFESIYKVQDAFIDSVKKSLILNL